MVLALAPSAASAQAFPSKPIHLVTSYVPGSSGDNNLRIVVPTISASMGQPVVIETRAGAGGVVAAEYVVRSAPDGYTLLASSSGTHVIRPFLVKNMSFDPAKDLTPITQYTDVAACIVVGNAVPVQSLRELIEYAKKNPNKVAYGTSGVGTEHHLTAEQIMQLTGVKLLHVPYKSGATAMLDVVSGQLAMSIGTVAAAQPLAASGKLRIVGVVRNGRLERLPDVPALPEVVPGFEPPSSWTGIFGPARLPKEIATRISSEFARALKNPEIREKTIRAGNEPAGTTPEEFAASIQKEIALVGRIVKIADIKPE
jgi:tripartite-type tricarboxylate transporter receptor subunit TctC